MREPEGFRHSCCASKPGHTQWVRQTVGADVASDGREMSGCGQRMVLAVAEATFRRSMTRGIPDIPMHLHESKHGAMFGVI